MTLIVLSCAGLAVDGGRIIGAKVHAADQAENAARAGAQQLASARGGELTLDPARARAAAESYLASVGVSGVVNATTEHVVVTVTEVVETTLLQLIGVSSKRVVATRSSAPVSE